MAGMQCNIERAHRSSHVSAWARLAVTEYRDYLDQVNSQPITGVDTNRTAQMAGSVALNVEQQNPKKKKENCS